MPQGIWSPADENRDPVQDSIARPVLERLPDGDLNVDHFNRAMARLQHQLNDALVRLEAAEERIAALEA